MTEIKEYFVELIKNGDKYDGKFLNNCKDSYTELKDSYPVSQDLSNRNVIKITVEMRDGKKIYKAVKVICNIGKDEKNEQQQKQEQQDNLKSPDTILTSQNEEPYTKEDEDMKQKVISAYLASKENQKQFLSQRPLPEVPVDTKKEDKSSSNFVKKEFDDSTELKNDDFLTLKDLSDIFFSNNEDKEPKKDNLVFLEQQFSDYEAPLNKILPNYFDLKQLETDVIQFENYEKDIPEFLLYIIDTYFIHEEGKYPKEKKENLKIVLDAIPYLLQNDINNNPNIEGGKKSRKYKKSRKSHKIKKTKKSRK